ncbi:DMT family transporter [Bordetella genomosp. 13]|uniref:EamA family transporter n=1 Tax=Bordetella genomosp. 13 TaxID=463040 RepID=A0A1W6ZAG2_9BORD|nr:EamA family transporter [Bordetella genomosp. 13]ARP94235.1 EamA family transporter [Bordetella genomosp. 13]
MSASLQERTGLMQMAAAMTLSGTLGYFVLESGQSPWNIVFLRCVFGALGLLAYCAARGLLRPGLFTARTLGLALLAGAALVFNWVLLFSAYRLASISLSTAVYNMQPFILIGLGAAFLGERPTRGKLAWTAVAFGGLLLVLRVSPARLGDGQDYLVGLALALGAGALYAVTAILVKRLTGVPPQVLALVQVALGAVLLLPLADLHALPQAPAQWGSVVALGLVHTSLMYILLYSALQKLPTSSAAPLSFIYPVVAMLLDYVVYGQRLAAVQWLGVALIFVAVAGVSLRRTPTGGTPGATATAGRAHGVSRAANPVNPAPRAGA